MTATVAKNARVGACPPYPLSSEPAVQRWTDDNGSVHVVCTDTDAETRAKALAAIEYWSHPACPERKSKGADLADGNAAHWRARLGAVEERMARER